MKKIIVTLLTACVGGAVAIGAYKLMENQQVNGLSLDEKQKLYFANNPANITSSVGAVDFVQAAAAVTPAVVHINTTYEGQSSTRQGGSQQEMGDLFDQFFGAPQMRSRAPVMASGSGVIISDDGYIVTNNHVVEDATKIEVVLTDKRSFEGKVIGRDANTDLALIKVSATNLPIVKLGNSDNVQVGEWVLAVGYPLALESTVTAGIVSAKGRSIGILDQPRPQQFNNRNGSEPQQRTAIESFIQTDAAINRGNSGGALVNANGELVGINAAIASQSGTYEGYGFAIPINLAKKVLDDFKEFGAVKRGVIGVSFRDLNASAAKELGIEQINGLYVNDVAPGSGAASAGLKQGDIITKVENNTIYASSDLQERVGRLRPGDKIQLTYLRNGKPFNASVTLKDVESVKFAGNTAAGRSSAEIYSKLGAGFSPLTAAQKQRYRISSGVIVSEVRSGGIFDDVEIPKGAIITQINGKDVNSREEINTALGVTDQTVTIKGIADGGSFRVTVPIQ